jgi:hypothetical protein
MPVIYMKHAIHGAKVANMEAEAVADEANGWVRYTLDTPAEEVVAPVNVLEVKRRRKTADESA